MKWLFVSENAESLGLAMHLTSEGHSVGFVMKNAEAGTGLVDRNPEEGAADINVVEGEQVARDADELRGSGLRVFGDSRWSNAIANNPDYVKDLARAIGWPVDKVNSGINLYTTVWFNGRNFVSVYTSFVYRRFMSSGKGPDIGYAGSVSSFAKPTARMQEHILDPLAKILKKVNHRGCFHVQSLVNGDDYCVKTLSASSSHPLALAAFENSKVPCTDLILRSFNELSEPLHPIDNWTACVMFSVPPYPYTDSTIDLSEVKGIEPSNLKHLWLVDMMRDNGVWKQAGLSGKLGYATARGSYPSEAVGRVYRTLRNLSAPDLQYRDDIGRNVSKLIDVVRGHGWIG